MTSFIQRFNEVFDRSKTIEPDLSRHIDVSREAVSLDAHELAVASSLHEAEAHEKREKQLKEMQEQQERERQEGVQREQMQAR